MNPNNRKFHDAAGYVRVAVRFGRSSAGLERPPYVQFASGTGKRVDRHGRPVRQCARANFSPVEWDLAPPDRASAVAAAPTIPSAWPLVTRSAAFVRLFDGVRRAAFSFAHPRSDDVSCVHVGTTRIDIAEAPRHGFAARLVEQVAIAFAFGDGCAFPIADAQAADFARVNAGYLLERYGRAKLLAALVRDEILAAGDVDIGGPGLRGEQLEIFDRHRMGELTFEVAATEIARSSEGDTGAPFDEAYGPPAGLHLHEAFIARPPVTRARVGPVVAPLVALLTRLGDVEHATPDGARNALGLGFEVIDISNVYWTLSRSAATAGATHLELHEPNDGSPRGRFVVYPDEVLTFDQLAAALPGGVPVHVGARASDRHATMAFPVGRRTVFASFDFRSGTMAPLVVGP